MAKKKAKLSESGYSWVSGNVETEIGRGPHGDIYIGQTKNEERCGIGYYDSGWIVAPLIMLSYVNDINADTGEIENWRKYMMKYGWKEPEYFSAMWEYENDFRNMHISRVDEKSKKISFDRFPAFTQSAGLHGPDVFPVIGRNDDLVFLVEYIKKGDKPVAISIRGKDSKCKECLRIPKTDVNYLFRGLVHFSNSFGYGSCERMNNLAKILADWETVRKG